MSIVLVKVKDGLAPGLRALYYSWSGEEPPEDLLSLQPVKEEVLPWINYVWWDSPSPGVPAEFFAIAWLGFIKIQVSGEYRFYVTTDDGSRLWIDGKLIIDAWKDQPPTTYISEPVYLEEGLHRLKYYFYNRYAFAEAVLGWIPENGRAGPIPKEAYYHSTSRKVLFVNLPKGFRVLVEGKTISKTCVSRDSQCEIHIDCEEMPLKAVLKITNSLGKELFNSNKKTTLIGGDIFKLLTI